MKKDLKSYIEHDKDYKKQFDVDSFRRIKSEYDKLNIFENDGFKKAIELSKNKIKHIDIGSGGGWLILKTSPLFENVIGIEPSKSACDNVSVMIRECGFKNIQLINSDMIDAIKNLNLKEPVFFTTAIVLSHIEDFYTKEFLQLLCTSAVAHDSTLYFCERYDKNIQQKLWHIRRKYWWAKNLPEWQLEFFGIENSGYKSGIFGRKVGKEKVENKYTPTSKDDLLWFIDGIKQKTYGLGRFISRLIRK